MFLKIFFKYVSRVLRYCHAFTFSVFSKPFVKSKINPVSYLHFFGLHNMGKNNTLLMSFVYFSTPYYYVIKKTALKPSIYGKKKFIALLYICLE